MKYLIGLGMLVLSSMAFAASCDFVDPINKNITISTGTNFASKDFTGTSSYFSGSYQVNQYLSVGGKVKDKYKGVYNVGMSAVLSKPMIGITPYWAYTESKDIALSDFGKDVGHKIMRGWDNDYSVGAAHSFNEYVTGHVEADDFLRGTNDMYAEFGASIGLSDDLSIGADYDVYKDAKNNNVGVDISYLI